MNNASLQLRAGREKPVLHGHPWIFSGAIADWHGRPNVGDPVEIFSHDGTWLARGLANPQASLPVRIYTRNQQQPLDEKFFASLVSRALSLRSGMVSETTNACRLVFSEADGLSGLIVDRYADALSIHISAAALVPHLPAMLAHISKETGITRIHLTADEDDAAREKMPDSFKTLSSPETSPVRILHDSHTFEVDITSGQKTGFYLDQRFNRARIAAHARDRRVLSCHCYTGALEVYLDRSGAKEITSIDSSGPALVQAKRHAELNSVKIQIEWLEADVPLALRKFRDQAKTFDLIILDPPKLVLNAAQKDRGLRAYKDINLLAMKLLTPGGILATFSCSGLVTREDLKMVLGWSAKDANRTVQILEQLSQPPDHPVLIGVPETEYLHGFICSVNP
jgi:23S rRNA (cytosine1962-C5)-methyltransferase